MMKWKEDNRPKRRGWAPGAYLGKCHSCGDMFVGDKRALTCADCAYKPRLFCDMDGVLADFDTGHEIAFGYRPSKLTDNVDWDAVRVRKDFYRDLPPMPDMRELWDYIAPYKPIILTGVPSIPEAPSNKKAWALKHFGPKVNIITCKSSEKCLHALPGDRIIDDWDKHKQKWLDVGGIWITHVSAAMTIETLKEQGL